MAKTKFITFSKIGRYKNTKYRKTAHWVLGLDAPFRRHQWRNYSLIGLALANSG
jgi:hypothetical protein